MNEAVLCDMVAGKLGVDRPVVPEYRKNSQINAPQSPLAGHGIPDRDAARLRRGLARAWHQLAGFQIELALQGAMRVDRQAGLLPDSTMLAVRSEAKALRAAAFALQGDVMPALTAAQAALESGAASHIALTVCRWAYWRLGDLDGLYAVRRRLPGSQPAPLHSIVVIFDLALDAAIALSQMHFNAASVLAYDALNLARRHPGHGNIDVFPACVAAQVLYETGRIDEAEALIAPRFSSIAKMSAPEIAVRAYGLLARIALQRGHIKQALMLLEEAETLAVQRNWTRLQLISLAGQVETHLARRSVADAQLVAKRLTRLCEQTVTSGVSIDFEMRHHRVLTHARLALARAPETVDICALRQLYVTTRSRRDRYGAVKVAVLLIESLLATGQRDEATLLLVALLETAALTGLHQTVVDCSEPVCGLIEAMVRGDSELVDDQRELIPYLAALLTRRQHEMGARNIRMATLKVGKAVPQVCLSERERTIVQLMGKGLTNKQIAIRLRIAPETVKSHAKHLYTKLSAKNRMEAVAIASVHGHVQLLDRGSG